MMEVQMMMGLKGSWVLTNFLVIRLTEFTGPPCTINTHTFVHTDTEGEKNAKICLVRSSCCFNTAQE